MDLKALLGGDYKEGMTLDEINAALAGKNLVDPSTLPPSVSKKMFDENASELAAAKKKLKELEEANLTDAEKLKKIQEAAEEAQRIFTVKSNRMDVEKVLISAGLAEADYAPFIDTIVTVDAEASKNAAKAIATMIAAQKKAVEAAVRKEQQDNTPKPGAQTNPPAMTKADFTKLSFDEQNRFFTEHREEYNKLFE
jgi:hypothetical protein